MYHWKSCHVANVWLKPCLANLCRTACIVSAGHNCMLPPPLAPVFILRSSVQHPIHPLPTVQVLSAQSVVCVALFNIHNIVHNIVYLFLPCTEAGCWGGAANRAFPAEALALLATPPAQPALKPQSWVACMRGEC